jgi:hypothetical protein
MIFLLSDRPLAFEEIDQFVREGRLAAKPQTPS